MPRVTRTIIPRIRKSLQERGLSTSLRRSFLLPFHLLDEYRFARSLRPSRVPCDFDHLHGVDTEGSFEGWTYLSDLEIPSPNWIEGNNYAAIEPERFERVLASFATEFDGFTFIDFGSGKGRALLMASEHPFKRIVGMEFSPELHRTAQENIRQYRTPTQKCKCIESLNVDFVECKVPPGPLLLFFFHPCRSRLLSRVVQRIGDSWRSGPRPLYVAYVAPTAEEEQVLATADFLEEIDHNLEFRFRLYRDRGHAARESSQHA